MPAPCGVDPERAVLQAEESGRDSSGSGSDAEAATQAASRRRLCAAGSALLVASVVLVAASAAGNSSKGANRSEDVSGGAVVFSDVESAGLGLVGKLAEQMESMGKAIDSTMKTYNKVGKYGKEMGDLESTVTEGVANNDQLRTELGGHPQGSEQWVDPASAEDLIKMLKNGSFDELAANRSNFDLIKSLLRPQPNGLHNQNLCNDDEEEFGGLCYKQCKLLTEGEHPVRSTAFSCCKDPPCQLWNTKFKISVCSGFNVAGDSVNGGCPHAKGACYADEEMFSSTCYRKCELLTEGKFNWRAGPTTCCKFKGQGLCTSNLVSLTKQEFAVSGGQYERVNVTEVSPIPHGPVLAQTEVP